MKASIFGLRAAVACTACVLTFACGDDEGTGLQPLDEPLPSEVDAGVPLGDAAPVQPSPDAAADVVVPVEAAPPVVEVPLGELPFLGTSGYGPVEKDRSNGDALAGDGLPITIGGVVYPKGLGVHSPSEITFDLGRKYKRFIADVGVDDEIGNTGVGSVQFFVFADDVLVFDSGVVNGAMPAVKCDVSVGFTQVLKLVVTNGGDDTSYDHADWAGARVLK